MEKELFRNVIKLGVSTMIYLLSLGAFYKDRTRGEGDSTQPMSHLLMPICIVLHLYSHNMFCQFPQHFHLVRSRTCASHSFSKRCTTLFCPQHFFPVSSFFLVNMHPYLYLTCLLGKTVFVMLG